MDIFGVQISPLKSIISSPNNGLPCMERRGEGAIEAGAGAESEKRNKEFGGEFFMRGALARNRKIR